MGVHLVGFPRRYHEAVVVLLRWGQAANKCKATQSQCKVSKFPPPISIILSKLQNSFTTFVSSFTMSKLQSVLLERNKSICVNPIYLVNCFSLTSLDRNHFMGLKMVCIKQNHPLVIPYGIYLIWR